MTEDLIRANNRMTYEQKKRLADALLEWYAGGPISKKYASADELIRAMVPPEVMCVRQVGWLLTGGRGRTTFVQLKPKILAAGQIAIPCYVKEGCDDDDNRALPDHRNQHPDNGDAPDE